MDQDTNTQNQDEPQTNPQAPNNPPATVTENPVPVTDYLNTDLKDIGKNDYEKTTITDYHSVPFYRRTWFIVITFLFFIPATILIILTGDVYRLNRKDNTVNKWTSQTKTGILLMSFLVIIYGLSNLF